MCGKKSHVYGLWAFFPQLRVTIRITMPSPLPSPEPPPALVAGLRRVLRPLVRLMVARGITYPYLADLLKGLFVEVADRDFRLDGAAPTDSRVSLLSGVHRKDVSRLRAQAAAPDDAVPPVPPVVTLTSQVVARWLGDPAWRTGDGAPRALPRSAADGRSFDALVAGISTDIRPRVLLDDWLDRGLATLDEAGRVCLNTGALAPARGDDDKLAYFVRQLHDHAAAASHNLLGGAPFFDRSVHADGLSPDDLAALQALARERAMQTLLAVNEAAQTADAAASAAGADGSPRQRFTLGIYWYSEPAEPPPPKEHP